VSWQLVGDIVGVVSGIILLTLIFIAFGRYWEEMHK
jgi:hypothetical protein